MASKIREKIKLVSTGKKKGQKLGLTTQQQKTNETSQRSSR